MIRLWQSFIKQHPAKLNLGYYIFQLDFINLLLYF